MKTAIDLNQLIEDKDLDLDKGEIAVQLFPDNKYPKLALDRVLRNESALDANQISKLSAITGVSVEDLFSGGWKCSTTEDTWEFTKGDYKAVYKIKTKNTSIYRGGSLAHEFIIHSSTIPLSDYIRELKTQIEKLK